MMSLKEIALAVSFLAVVAASIAFVVVTIATLLRAVREEKDEMRG